MKVKITEYKILFGSMQSLPQEVNKAIEDGWQPYGDTILSGEMVFTQPVVKYKYPPGTIYN